MAYRPSIPFELLKDANRAEELVQAIDDRMNDDAQLKRIEENMGSVDAGQEFLFAEEMMALC